MPYELSSLGCFYYMIQFGHHTERFVQYVFTSKKSSTFYLMILHHLLTLFMIFYSYLFKFTMWGFAIFFLFDVTDIIINLSRFLNEFNKTKNLPTDIVFVLTNIFWFTNRIYAYNKEIIFKSLFYL